MAASMREKIRGCAGVITAPSGAAVRVLSMEAVRAIADQSGAGRRDIEIAALEEGIIPLRYQRNAGTIGIEGQLKLRRARVAVVGAGGLGGTIIELLARLGIGTLVVIDRDVFSEDNLNRQILSTEDAIGRPKVEVAAGRVARVNSAVGVVAHHTVVDRGNIDSLIQGCDVVIDALDSIPTRLLVQEAATRINIPFVHGAIAGFLGEVMTVFPGDRGLMALYGDGQGAAGGLELRLGTPSVTPSLVAAFQVMEAVKLILGTGAPLRHRLLCIDLLEGSISDVKMEPRS
ncbi:MAG: HesA/MoeB/ThiF family protein [Candidatus Aureabacteria bacterium]|nr:HesA/MoeB/ThiF family protein [Candidatus Auribacterota bacterium]